MAQYSVTSQSVISDPRQLPAGLRRLVVLVPEAPLDEALLARRVWLMASPRRAVVLLVGLAHDANMEASLRRRLTTLAALTMDADVTVEIQVTIGADWLPVIAGQLKSGDAIVCHAGQLARSRLGRTSMLAPVLADRFAVPVCELQEFLPAPPSRRSVKDVVLGLVPVGIIGAFLEAQILISQAAKGWMQATLIGVTVMAEFGLIWLWESLNG
jgi:hypothetical protein